MANKLSERFTKEYITKLGALNPEDKPKKGFTFGDAIKQNRRKKDDKST